jgi:hypothetical protein
MRLRLIQKVLEATVNDLQVSFKGRNGDSYGITGLQSALNAVKKIQETGVLTAEIQQVFSTGVCSTYFDELFVNEGTYNSFTRALQNLRERGDSLYYALQDLIQDDSQEIVSFRLPDSIQLDELTLLVDDLKKILEQSFVNEYINGKIDFQGFDRGSYWIEIGLGSLVAVGILGEMTRFIQDLLDFQQKHRAREIMIQELDLQVEVRQSFSEALKKELDLFTSQGTQSLLRQAGIPENDHEINKRFEYSIGKLSQWMERGLEVHPSLTAPPETQRLFPDAERILESMKLLPGNVDAD